LERSFEKWWPDLADAIANIPEVVQGDPPPRPEREILEEILNLARQATREQFDRIAMAESVARARQEDLMVITHQIQGPLISVSGALSMGKHEVTAPPLSNIEYAREMVEDVLVSSYGIFTAFAISQGQSVSLRPVEMNVQEILRKLAARIQRTNARSDLRFRFDESVDFPPLLLDEQSFTSVLYALIHNAIKYADSDSDVIFECGLAGPDRMPVLKVISTGEPIPLTDHERVFSKFARTAQARRYGGAGLGLWVARELMRQLGGDVTLELSPHAPRVSRFVVHFGSRSVR
jgi:signal transduction histidine kinase